VLENGIGIVECGCATPITHRCRFQNMKTIRLKVTETSQVIEEAVFLRGRFPNSIKSRPKFLFAFFFGVGLCKVRENDCKKDQIECP